MVVHNARDGSGIVNALPVWRVEKYGRRLGRLAEADNCLEVPESGHMVSDPRGNSFGPFAEPRPSWPSSVARREPRPVTMPLNW